MRICVLGGAGGMAYGASLDFIEQDEVDSVVLCDREYSALEARRDALASPKVEIKKVDVSDLSAVRAALDGSDVCLQATTAEFNISTMEQCLKTGTHYTDLGGRFKWTKLGLEMDKQFKEAGLTAVVNSGASPGMIQVQARLVADRLDTLESMDVILGVQDSPAGAGSSRHFTLPFAARTLLEELYASAWVFRDGKYMEVPPQSGRQDYVFPDPVGKVTTHWTLHSEMATLPLSFAPKGIKNVSYSLGYPAGFVEAVLLMIDAGLASTEPVTVGGVTLTPLDMLEAVLDRQRLAAPIPPDSHYCSRLVATGTRGGVKYEVTCDVMCHQYHQWPAVDLTQFITGFPAAVTCRMLGSGVISERGANASEVIVPPEPYFARLAERGLVPEITERVLEPLAVRASPSC
jgi:saccharopine dehydrogenase (NAD+, L-lysine-forming)